MSWPTHDSTAATVAFLEFSDAEWAKWSAGPYVLESRDTGALVGSSGFGFKAIAEAEVGYVLARRFWGLGLATETLSAIVDLARDGGVLRLHAGCHPHNTASAHVLEKCGFSHVDGSPGTDVFPNLDPRLQVRALSYSLEFDAAPLL